MSSSAENRISKLIVAALLIAPTQNLGELALIFSGLYIPNQSATISVTPVWIKALKDLIVISMILLGSFWKLHSSPRIWFWDILFGFSVSVAISLYCVFGEFNLLVLLAGLRAFYPLFLFPLLRGIITPESMCKIARVLVYLLILMLALQIYELFHMPRWDGETVFGLNKRNPGFFLVINSAGFFCVIAYIFIFWHESNHLLRMVFCIGIIPACIFLTASGSAVLSLFLLSSLSVYGMVKQKSLILLLIPLCFIVGVSVLSVLTQRDDIYSSPETRLQIFISVIQDVMIPIHFGEGTNAAVLLKSAGANGVIVDSTITSLLYNLGAFGFICFFLMAVNKVRIDHECVMVFCVLAIFMLSTIVYEIFPMNILSIVYIAYLARPQNNPYLREMK